MDKYKPSKRPALKEIIDGDYTVHSEQYTGGLAASAALPCLNSNNSAETPQKTPKTPVLSVSHRRAAAALSWNVEHFVSQCGLENVGMLTLTFPRKVLIPKNAQKKFNNLRKHVLAVHFGQYIKVFERQKSGSIHYHLLIDCGFDIRTGLDWEQLEKRIYSSANSKLRKLWAMLREELPKYGFGRSELLPIKTTAEAMGKYVGKYIGKHVDARMWQDKGVRLVEYSSKARMATCNFQFASPGSKLWREKTRSFAMHLGQHLGKRLTYEDLSRLLGDKWAFNNRHSILSLDLDNPSLPIRIAPVRPDSKNVSARGDLDFIPW
jgi:hypothetical protein